MAIENAADRVLKLPLDSPFNTNEPQDHDHSHDDQHDHHGTDLDSQRQHQHQHQHSHDQEDSEQYDTVSLSESVPPAFGGVTDDSLVHNGTEGEKNTPVKKHQDSSLTAAAAAAVASIQDVWSENFNEPLPTNKEERIQQALEFMNSEKQAHGSDKNIKKHSIRQIALFFQVPKSTLYDRLKSKSNDLNANSIIKLLPPHNSSPKPHALSASRSHQQQMKLSIEKEDILLSEVRNLSHAYGNTLNYTQIREFIMSLVNGISLGKKWIHNFTRRHDEFIVYGTYNSRFNVKMKRSKSCRCDFDYLWRCFIPLLQEKIRSLPQDKPFYYITRTCIHQSSMSSVFTCFEIIPNEMSIKSIMPPKLLIFPDYFGKIYLHQNQYQNRSKMINDNNNNNSSNNDIDNNENKNDGENDMRNSHGNENNEESNGREEFKQNSLHSDMNNNNSNNSNSNNDNNINENNLPEELSDHSSRINKQEKKYGHFKIDKLNEAFAKIYAECCQSASNSEIPFVVFEGFDDRYNWNALFCKDMVQTDRFLSLPWNQQLFQQNVSTSLRGVIDATTESSSIAAIESSSYETDLTDENLSLDIFEQEFQHIINLHTELLNSNEAHEHDSVQLNDLNVFEPALHAAAAAAAAAAATSSSTASLNTDIEPQHGSFGKTSQQSRMENVTSANIFENSTISQLQDVISMIDNNESQLYGDLVNSNSKTTLMTIFNKIKGIVPQ